MKVSKLKNFLESKYAQYCSPQFIKTDPIQIPHRFTRKEDIEIAGFLAATIAWGQRPTIIRNAERLLSGMNNAPFDFVLNHKPKDLQRFEGFVHRTFNYDDVCYFFTSLQNIYRHHGGMEKLFEPRRDEINMKYALGRFRYTFFELEHLPRSRKHVSDPFANSACKRLNMFLRWMARPADGIDFGLWKSVSPALLSCPLDVHSGRVARKLGLLERNANDWKAVEELDQNLRAMNPEDPVRYDFALFGLGVFEKF